MWLWSALHESVRSATANLHRHWAGFWWQAAAAADSGGELKIALVSIHALPTNCEIFGHRWNGSPSVEVLTELWHWGTGFSDGWSWPWRSFPPKWFSDSLILHNTCFPQLCLSKILVTRTASGLNLRPRILLWLLYLPSFGFYNIITQEQSPQTPKVYSTLICC